MEDSHFRGDDELVVGRDLWPLDHPLGREDLHSHRIDVPRRHRLDDAGSAAAFGVNEELGTRMRRALQPDVLGIDPGVHVTLAHPHVHVLAAADAPHVRAEEHVGEK